MVWKYLHPGGDSGRLFNLLDKSIVRLEELARKKVKGVACNVSLIIQRNSSLRVMCAAFKQAYFGRVTKNCQWDPVGSSSCRLPPLRCLGRASAFTWELISIPRLPGGTGMLYICPRILDNFFLFSLLLDAWCAAVPGNL